MQLTDCKIKEKQMEGQIDALTQAYEYVEMYYMIQTQTRLTTI